MKTPEETLKQWTCDQIVFDGGGADPEKGPPLYTRDALEALAEILNDPEDVVRRDADLMRFIDETFVETLQHYRIGGPAISAQFLAQFGSLQEVLDYYRNNHWLDESAIEEAEFQRYLDEKTEEPKLPEPDEDVPLPENDPDLDQESTGS